MQKSPDISESSSDNENDEVNTIEPSMNPRLVNTISRWKSMQASGESRVHTGNAFNIYEDVPRQESRRRHLLSGPLQPHTLHANRPVSAERRRRRLATDSDDDDIQDDDQEMVRLSPTGKSQLAQEATFAAPCVTTGQYGDRYVSHDSPAAQEQASLPSKLSWWHRVPICYILVAFGVAVIAGSLAVGLYYSIAQDRMGDGFTTAGFMVAVGTLILAAPMAKHYPKCRCWGADEPLLP